MGLKEEVLGPSPERVELAEHLGLTVEQLERLEELRVVGREAQGDSWARNFLDEFGRELVDPTPMAPPVGFKAQPSMFETMRAMVRSASLAAAAAAEGMDSFEDANDFDVPDDDFDPRSPWEEQFDPGQSDRDIGDAIGGRLRPAGAPPGGAGGSPPPEGGTPAPGASAPPPQPSSAPASPAPSGTQS